MWEWLMAPMDPSRPHDIGNLASWHARFMAVGWGVCIPTGIVIARYFKVVPGQNWPKELDNQFWWRSHLTLQNTGIILMALGAVIVWRSDLGGLHALLGWGIVALGILQILTGFFRGTKGGPDTPGDHYDMTQRRRVFEHVHKALGYFLLGLALVNIVIGLWITNAPVWMTLVLATFWLGLGAVCIFRARVSARIETYQAIWGPGREHPGNR